MEFHCRRHRPCWGSAVRAAPSSWAAFQALGLRVAWFVYRGGGKVTFDPEQFQIYQDTRRRATPRGRLWKTRSFRWMASTLVKAVFSEPGTYVLRCLAHDGGLGASEDVTVTVFARWKEAKAVALRLGRSIGGASSGP